jgi:hypothetical protein
MDPITVTLDKQREIRWTHRADARLGSLERAPVLRDLVHKNPRRAYYALLAFLWAGLVERHDFTEPEALADHVHSDDQQRAAFTALHAALVAGGVIEDQKKTTSENDSSKNGHSPSSNSEPRAHATST